MQGFYKWLSDKGYGGNDNRNTYLYLKHQDNKTIIATDLMLVGYKIRYLLETKRYAAKYFYSIDKLLDVNFLDDLIRSSK